MLPRAIMKGCKHYSMFNILLNAVAAMLVYGAHFGMTIISPAMLDALDGQRGINKHLVYTGLSVSCFVTVLSCAMITPLINKLGTKFCLITGAVLISMLHPAMIYPIPAIYCIAQGLNGVGCALLRASSLKYLTDNSTERDLAKNNSIHWSIFMASLIVGNGVVMIVTGNNAVIDDKKRIQITSALIALNSAGIIIYCFARAPYQSKDDDEETPILRQRPSNSQSSNPDSGIEDGSIFEGITMENQGNLEESQEYPSTAFPTFEKESGDVTIPYTPPDKAITPPDSPHHKTGTSIRSKIVLNLVFTMICCGAMAGVYGTTVPDFIGRTFTAKVIVPAFGICVGVGEIFGSVIIGSLITTIGVKKSVCCVSLLGVLMFVLTSLIFPLTDMADPILTPHYTVALLIGLGLGMSDVGFGVILSTLIGRIFKGNSQTAFSLYSAVFNLTVVASCLLSSYGTLLVIVFVFSGLLVCAVIGILMIENTSYTDSDQVKDR